MKSLLINMCLAAYLSSQPDEQVRKLAKEYKSLVQDQYDKMSLDLIIQCSKPAQMVKLAYLNISSSSR